MTAFCHGGQARDGSSAQFKRQSCAVPHTPAFSSYYALKLRLSCYGVQNLFEGGSREPGVYLRPYGYVSHRGAVDGSAKSSTQKANFIFFFPLQKLQNEPSLCFLSLRYQKQLILTPFLAAAAVIEMDGPKIVCGYFSFWSELLGYKVGYFKNKPR